jgi:hypothetical protein
VKVLDRFRGFVVTGFGLVGLKALIASLDKIVTTVFGHYPPDLIDAHQPFVIVAEENVLESRLFYQIVKNTRNLISLTPFRTHIFSQARLSDRFKLIVKSNRIQQMIVGSVPHSGTDNF